MNPHGKCRAYSLYELLMTLTIAAVVVGLGLPSFGKLVADNRLRVEVDALFHAVYLARKESIARRRVVTICPSIDGFDCANTTDWSAGWIMFVNRGMQNTLRRADDEELLRYHRANPETRVSANRRGFSLRSTWLRATNGTIVFCDITGRTESRALVISYTGRPRVARKTTSGKPYECTV